MQKARGTREEGEHIGRAEEQHSDFPQQCYLDHVGSSFHISHCSISPQDCKYADILPSSNLLDIVKTGYISYSVNFQKQGHFLQQLLFPIILFIYS